MVLPQNIKLGNMLEIIKILYMLENMFSEPTSGLLTKKSCVSLHCAYKQINKILRRDHVKSL